MIIPNPFTFIGALARMVWAWLHGELIFVPPDEEVKRLNSCQNCPSFDPEDRQCTVCTCFVDLKCAIATEKCPRWRWGRYWGLRH